MADRMTRFDVDLIEAAADEGRRESRSGRQQLEHWTRIGRMVSAYETETRRRIASAVRGEVPLSTLDPGGRLGANIELDVAIRERAASVSFGRGLLAAGLRAVALDDEGSIVEFSPNGSRSLVDDRTPAARPVVAG
jgi:ParD-like antitoxin of type II bacterial toxin-antitoxin system